MCRKEIISKCVGLAMILLVAFMMVFSQPRSISTVVSAPAETENQFSFQQGLDSAISFGLVHNDTQFVTAFILAVLLLFSCFPVKAISSVHSTSTTILSRNYCCIVPKGP